MKENWNPIEDHIEGKLCEKGFMKETYNFDEDDLVRNLTPKGKQTATNLLKERKWVKEYLNIAKAKFSKYPKETQVILWKKLIKDLKKIN